MGAGSAEGACSPFARIGRLGLSERVRIRGRTSATASARPRVRGPPLRRDARRARDVRSRRFEAAASGAVTVACNDGAVPRGRSGPLVRRFEPGDVGPCRGDRARPRATARSPRAALFAAAHRWERAFAAELTDLERLAGAAMTALAGRRSGHGALAVALHDVEPATFERCALIRDWLETSASTA